MVRRKKKSGRTKPAERSLAGSKKWRRRTAVKKPEKRRTSRGGAKRNLDEKKNLVVRGKGSLLNTGNQLRGIERAKTGRKSALCIFGRRGRGRKGFVKIPGASCGV